MKWSIFLGVFLWCIILLTLSDMKGGDNVAETLGSPVQYKRLFIDIPVSTDDKLKAEATARGVSKKALVEQLILDMANKPTGKKRSK